MYYKITSKNDITSVRYNNRIITVRISKFDHHYTQITVDKFKKKLKILGKILDVIKIVKKKLIIFLLIFSILFYFQHEISNNKHR